MDRLSEYIGPKGVRDLVKDFNRTNPSCMREGEGVRKVPGVGPRRGKVQTRGGTGPLRPRRRRYSARSGPSPSVDLSRREEDRDSDTSLIPGSSKSDLGPSRRRTSSTSTRASGSNRMSTEASSPYQVLDTIRLTSQPIRVERGRRSLRGLEFLKNKLRSRSRTRLDG